MKKKFFFFHSFYIKNKTKTEFYLSHLCRREKRRQNPFKRHGSFLVAFLYDLSVTCSTVPYGNWSSWIKTEDLLDIYKSFPPAKRRVTRTTRDNRSFPSSDRAHQQQPFFFIFFICWSLPDKWCVWGRERLKRLFSNPPCVCVCVCAPG